MKLAAIATTVGVALGVCGTASGYRFAPLVRGLASPVYVASAPGDRATLYVVEQAGSIRKVRAGRVVATFLDLRSRVGSGGERGLLSVAFHPDFARNHRFYVDYTDTSGDTHVVEFRARNGHAVLSSARELLFVRQPYSNHNGGQLQFDRAGNLYVGMGDGGSGGDPGNRAQNLQVRLGKILRTNPLTDAGWRIVGYGLRNPWRFSFDRRTGDLWIGDVGEATWEEVDFRPAARISTRANFGWNHWEGRAVYDAANPVTNAGPLVFPAVTYRHGPGCSVTGGYVYRGGAVPLARGRYFYGDYCSGEVWSFAVGSRGKASVVRAESSRLPGLSSFGEDGKGELYATTLAGTLYRLRP